MTMPQLIVMIGLFFSSLVTWAHGEDKPGPHGGFIQMPGAFHTELVAINKNALRVYLLDMQWKNPSLKDSELKMTHEQGKTSIQAICKPDQGFYLCQFPEGIDLTRPARLRVQATREKQKGNSVTYEVPLRLEEKAQPHHHHH